MRKKNIIKLSIITLILIISMSQAVESIGITPAGKLVEYRPGEKIEISLTIINNDQRSMTVSIYPEEKYSGLIIIKNNILEFKPEDKEKKIEAEIIIPKDLKPGLNTMNIIALEIPGFSKSDTGSKISATGSVNSQVRINVPYPGLYAEAKMQVDDQMEPTITVSAYNAGSQDIKEAYAEIDILGPTNELLGTINTQKESIPAKKEKKIKAKWMGKHNPGKYFARGVVYYDGKRIKVEKVFEIGNKKIDIININVENFILGNIVRLVATAKNNWNTDLKDVIADFEIINEKGEIVNRFSSISTDIQAYATGMIEAFWDTKNLNIGDYELQATIKNEGEESSFYKKIYISMDDLKFKDGQGTGMVTGGKDSKDNDRISLLTILVIILIILNIGFFTYMRKMKKS